MAHRKTERNPLFAGRWFEDDIILLCLPEREHGNSVAHVAGYPRSACGSLADTGFVYVCGRSCNVTDVIGVSGSEATSAALRMMVLTAASRNCFPCGVKLWCTPSAFLA